MFRNLSPLIGTLSLGLLLTLGSPALHANAPDPGTPGQLAAPSRLSKWMTLREFTTLAEELTHKVNLYQTVWNLDPAAEFYGGTPRDYLFWLKKQFRGVSSRTQALEVQARLRALKQIDSREFIASDSDVDVVTPSGQLEGFDAKAFDLQRLDVKNGELFDPVTREGKNERRQGFIPVEKLRLSSSGFIPWEGMGNGVQEAFEGRPTVHFATPHDFARSYYAKKGLNHPILLALRYIRVLAVQYWSEYGTGLPDKRRLFDIDAESERQTRAVIASVSDGKALTPFLNNPSFAKWANGSIQKAFRSHTNPTAALALMRHFGVEKVLPLYHQLELIDQYLFVKSRNAEAINQNLEKFKVDRREFYLDPNAEFPDRLLLHGVKGGNERLRRILSTGTLPSESGAAGPGLYGVTQNNLDLAIARGNGKEQVIVLEVDPQAKVVDITRGEGKRIFDEYAKAQGDALYGDEVYQAFCKAFGVDILSYPHASRAYVVKNRAALGKPSSYRDAGHAAPANCGGADLFAPAAAKAAK